jgi:hypothetical protein
MAKTSNLGFFLRKSLVGIDAPPVLEYIITTSAQITIGDAVEITDDPGYANVCDADDKVAGVAVGIVTVDGINIFGPNAPTVNGTISGDDTYTASATNKTVNQVKVQIVIPENALFYNEADSTLTLAEVGRYFALTATGDQVTGTGDGTARTAQLVECLSLAGGPNGGGEGLFRISRSHWTNVA